MLRYQRPPLSEMEQKFAALSPSYDLIVDPVCEKAEYYYMRWLVSLFVDGLSPDEIEDDVTYNMGRKSSRVTYIRKDYGASRETKLIIRAPENPLLEGMVVHSDTSEIMRPLYMFARYDLRMPPQHERLQHDLRKVSLNAPPVYDTLAIISSLLVGMETKLGPNFEDNIKDYSAILQSRGLANHWEF